MWSTFNSLSALVSINTLKKTNNRKIQDGYENMLFQFLYKFKKKEKITMT